MHDTRSMHSTHGIRGLRWQEDRLYQEITFLRTLSCWLNPRPHNLNDLAHFGGIGAGVSRGGDAPAYHVMMAKP